MLITVNTFDGHNINDGTNYRTMLLNPHGMPDAAPVFIDQANADSIDAGLYKVNVQTKVLSIKVLNYGSRYALISQLKTWFKRGTEGNLVATFADDSVQYQISCRVINLIQEPESGEYFTAILQTGISAWRAVTESVDSTWTVTGTGGTRNLAVGGKDETFLSVELTTVAGPASGYLYQNLYRLPNTPGLAHGLIPWCITIDTATPVAAGKMQADCDDLRVVDLNTGQELKRWIANPNNASTKVWVNLNLSKGFSLVSSAAVAASGAITYIQFSVTTDHQTKISQMPKTGIIYNGNEWFAYSSTDAVNCRLYISQRALFGTTEEAHSSGVTFLYIQYPLVIKYGNASVAAPSSTDEFYDDTKPLFSLSSSSNTQWVWSATDLFYDPARPNRTGGWKFIKRALGPNSKTFYIKQDATSGDPAIGLKVASYEAREGWLAENVSLRASLYRAAGVTTISMTGDKYRSNGNWLNAILYGVNVDRSDWVTVWSEATPASEDTWTAWTHSGVTVPSTTYRRLYVELWFFGGYPAAADAFAAMEALTCTADFNSSYVPTGALLGEANSYPLSATLENLTNGDSIQLDYMMLLTKTFTLDAEVNTVEYDGYSAYDAVTIDDQGRAAYLRLNGNETNQIQISGADLGELDIVLSWYRRRL